MTALLYLGAGIGLFIVGLIQEKSGMGQNELPLTRKDVPYLSSKKIFQEGSGWLLY